MKYLDGKNCDIFYLLTSDVTPEERFAIQKTYDTEKDYTFYTPDDELRKGCVELVEQNKFIREQCIKHSLPYYETAKDRIKVFEHFMQSYLTKS